MTTRPRVRFAPSPTGYLHVGGARTALFNWLFARHSGGVFVLRIEDTDRNRSSEAMTGAILEGMTWLGLAWDEGPYFQADGLERHRADALALLDAGSAYRCFCTAEELDARRSTAAASRDAFRYDRRCLRLDADEVAARTAAGEPFALRFRVPDGETSWLDAVFGEIRFDNADIEDFVILRSDGTPVYNMAVVSDDAAQAITHVIRGDDHVSNTPKQILLYQALERPLPVFAHLPMILGPDGKRLSKRHGATAVGEYHARGILPQAMFNYLALLGWSPGGDGEVLDAAEIVRRFTLEGINRKSAVFDPQKLEWMNGRYLGATPPEVLAPFVAEHIEARGLASRAELQEREEWLVRLIDLLRVRARTIVDLVTQAEPFFARAPDYQHDAVARHWKDRPAVRDRLAQVRKRLDSLPAWEAAPLEEALRTLAGELDLSAGKLIHPLRVALTGAASSPGIFEVAVLLGREETLRRLDRAGDWLAS